MMELEIKELIGVVALSLITDSQKNRHIPAKTDTWDIIFLQKL
jgi:hypothetical protein